VLTINQDCTSNLVPYVGCTSVQASIISAEYHSKFEC